MRRTTIALPVMLASVALAGCASSSEPEAAPTSDSATPTSITHPQDRDDCTAHLEHGVGQGNAPDRATITCGKTQRIVFGDFSNRAMNSYAPDAGVDQIIVVDGETRAWLRDGQGTCLVTHKNGASPVRCTPTDSGSPSPSEGRTVAPRTPNNSTA
ncbi:hypothetical protein [Kocuria rhizophila]|uniref:hypothetical protein n=1 Tax=Kocuria rhizophila TaxID=72000 RepID=UPI00190DCCC8|nr:hypothetical protein [Kocuria rhizophila]MBK4120922.1 hypothetical protein [Kocuria rhizophila]